MGCVSSKASKEDHTRDLVEVNNGGKCINHIVSLTSSTYGLLNLENEQVPIKDVAIAETEPQKQSVLQRSSPPNRRSEPEVIDALELMEGLEEGVPITGQAKKSPKSRVFLRGFADLDVRSPMRLLNQIASPNKLKRSGGKENHSVSGTPTGYSPKGSVLKPRNSLPAGLTLTLPVKGTPVGSKRESFTKDGRVSSAKRSFSPLFDPELIAAVEREMSGAGEGEEQIKKMVSPSPRTRKQRKSREYSESILNSFQQLCPPGGENAAVIYTTTLRGIRKTFEDCNKVRSIFESHDILVFERDISMDSGFKEELRKLMGKNDVRIPAVFVKGRLVGGADEVVKMEEEGKLGILLEGIPRAVVGCGGCGGFRFVMCRECNGSCKVMDLVEKKMVRCGQCNENGLLHCPLCCSPN